MTVCIVVLVTAVGTQVFILLGTLWGAMQNCPTRTFSADILCRRPSVNYSLLGRHASCAFIEEKQLQAINT